MKRILFSSLCFILTLPVFAKVSNVFYSPINPSEHFIVVLKSTVSSKGYLLNNKLQANELIRFTDLELRSVFNHALNGFVVKGSIEDIYKLSANANVDYIEQDQTSRASTLERQINPPWGLDRIDQRNKTLNGEYTYDRNGTGVNVYVLDTGVRDSHNEFGTRAKDGRDIINNTNNINGDCNGHGTHVAATIAGQLSGVAKQANIFSVRILDCNGSGSMSNMAKGIDWVVANGQKPAVINISAGGPAMNSVDTAVKNAVDAGFTVITAAGNDSSDACNKSPARAKEALTVGAIDSNDRRSGFSNYGQCVDVWAPGENIRSASHVSDTSFRNSNGTSMAAPHVAGIAALYLQGARTASAKSVINAIMRKPTFGKVTDRKTSDTPNLLAYSLATNNRYGIMHRYYNTNGKDHFFTANWSELQSAPQSGWVYEGILGYVERWSSKGQPLYRYYNSRGIDHFYTTNYNELGDGTANWKKEGIAGYLPAKSSQTTNIYRYWNSSVSDHHYTTNWSELGSGTGSWKYEGVAGQIYKQPQD